VKGKTLGVEICRIIICRKRTEEESAPKTISRVQQNWGRKKMNFEGSTRRTESSISRGQVEREKRSQAGPIKRQNKSGSNREPMEGKNQRKRKKGTGAARQTKKTSVLVGSERESCSRKNRRGLM